MEHINHYKLLN